MGHENGGRRVHRAHPVTCIRVCETLMPQAVAEAPRLTGSHRRQGQVGRPEGAAIGIPDGLGVADQR